MYIFNENVSDFNSVNCETSERRIDIGLQEGKQPLTSLTTSSSRAGQRRLRAEAMCGHVLKAIPDELVDILIKYGNNPDGIPALHYAIKKQDEKAVKLLIEHGADANAVSRPLGNFGELGTPRTALDYAAAYGTPEQIIILINAGATINVSPIRMNQYDLTDYYLPSPLHFALERNRTENVRILLENGADKDHFSNIGNYWPPPIYLAAQLGNVEVLKLFIQSEIDANYISLNYPSSPLASAISSGNIDCVRFLLEAGADPNLGKPFVRDRGNEKIIIPNIPFIIDSISNPGKDSYKTLSLLVEYNFDVNVKDQDERTLLIKLIERYDSIRNIPQIDIEQYVPLFLCIEAVLKKGVDVEAKDYWQRTAMTCASSPEIKDLLRKYGAKG